MSRVRIIGGGLTGVLAAFEAHRLGCRDIEIHERFDRLGGSALPVIRHGVEVRDSPLTFGPRGDRVRDLLEWHGLAFDDVEAACGSVTPSRLGPVWRRGRAGPALSGAAPTRTAAGAPLADWLRTFQPDDQAMLARYCQWRLAAWLDRVDDRAVAALGLDAAQPADIVPAPLRASLPRDGFAALFHACHRKLEALGVRIYADSLVSPRQAAATYEPGDVIVWTADPAPLFEMTDLPRAEPLARPTVTYAMKVDWSGPAPFYARSFIARGAVAGAHIYRSGGQAVLLAECVAETADEDLRRDVRAMLAAFSGDLELGEALGLTIRHRWGCLSLEATRRLAALREELSRQFGAVFLTAPWEIEAPSARFESLRRSLAQGLALASALDVAA